MPSDGVAQWCSKCSAAHEGAVDVVNNRQYVAVRKATASNAVVRINMQRTNQESALREAQAKELGASLLLVKEKIHHLKTEIMVSADRTVRSHPNLASPRGATTGASVVGLLPVLLVRMFAPVSCHHQLARPVSQVEQATLMEVQAATKLLLAPMPKRKQPEGGGEPGAAAGGPAGAELAGAKPAAKKERKKYKERQIRALPSDSFDVGEVRHSGHLLWMQMRLIADNCPPCRRWSDVRRAAST